MTTSRSEKFGNYQAVVANLNARWRVIECVHGTQWILQFRKSAETGCTSRWQSRSHCHTREALLRCSTSHAGSIDPAAAAILAALPVDIKFAHAAESGTTKETENV